MIDKLIKDIMTAKVYDLAVRTPLDAAPIISKEIGNEVLLKREDLQPVFSFKIRGAYNKIVNLSAEEKAKGVVCASAGNHAQGVAISAKHLGISATIVMPVTTPSIKVEAVRSHGATVVLKGDSYSDASDYCHQLKKEKGLVLVHPFDDPLVIAGQGTVAFELLQQTSTIDYIFVPVGGGGLLGGMAALIKELYPHIKVIGVEPEDSNAMISSINLGEKVVLEKVGIFADGVAVKQVGALTFDLCQKYVDDWVQVSTDEICSAIKNIYDDTRSIVEPAGALALAGIKRYVKDHTLSKMKMIAINTGANMNFDRLRFVADRTELGEHKEAIFAISIPEQPGALKQFCEEVIQKRSITEFNYRMGVRSIAHIFISVMLSDAAERADFIEQLNQLGFQYTDLTHNELAKSHVRYMVGGRSNEAKDEVIYRFTFPERPGALGDFLHGTSNQWNISLFHYRSQGGDYGRVLIGFEVAKEERSKFREVLKVLGYPFIEETENIAAQLFFKA